MTSIPSRDARQAKRDAATLTDEDMQLMDLLALHVICGNLREVRR